MFACVIAHAQLYSRTRFLSEQIKISGSRRINRKNLSRKKERNHFLFNPNRKLCSLFAQLVFFRMAQLFHPFVCVVLYTGQHERKEKGNQKRSHYKH